MTGSSGGVEKEARRFRRQSIEIPALLHCHDRFQRVCLLNVSRGGAGIEGAFGLMPGDAIKLEMIDRRMLTGVVIWAVGGRIGIDLDQLLAADDALLEPERPSMTLARRPISTGSH